MTPVALLPHEITLLRQLERQARNAQAAITGALEMVLASRGKSGQAFRLSDDGTVLLPVQMPAATPPETGNT